MAKRTIAAGLAAACLAACSSAADAPTPTAERLATPALAATASGEPMPPAYSSAAPPASASVAGAPSASTAAPPVPRAVCSRPLQHLRAASVSPDGRYLVVGRRFDESDGLRLPYAHVIDLQHGQLATSIELGGDGTDMRGGELRVAAWNATGDRLATVTDYFASKVRLWAVPGFRRLGGEAVNEFVTEVKFVGQEALAVSASGGANAIDTATGAARARVPPEPGSPARERTLLGTTGPAGLVLLDGGALVRLPATLAGGTSFVSSVGPVDRWAVSDDGKRAVLLGLEVAQVDLVAGRVVVRREADGDRQNGPEFRPRDSSFALSYRGFVGVHRFGHAEPYLRVRLEGASSEEVPVMGFARDGSSLYLAVGERVGVLALDAAKGDVTVPVALELPVAAVTAVRQVRVGGWLEIAAVEGSGRTSVRLVRAGSPPRVEATLEGIEALADPLDRFAFAVSDSEHLELVRLADRARVRLAVAGSAPPFTLLASAGGEGSTRDAVACLEGGAAGPVRADVLAAFVGAFTAFRP